MDKNAVPSEFQNLHRNPDLTPFCKLKDPILVQKTAEKLPGEGSKDSQNLRKTARKEVQKG